MAPWVVVGSASAKRWPCHALYLIPRADSDGRMHARVKQWHASAHRIRPLIWALVSSVYQVYRALRVLISVSARASDAQHAW